MSPGSMDLLSREQSSERRRANDDLAAGFAVRMADVLRAGDGPQSDVVVDEALAVGLSPTDVQSLVIAPAMVRIGDWWESGVATVAEEHLATSISHRALIKSFAVMKVGSKVRSGERVVLAALEGQHHVLGLRMIADVLEAAGFDVSYLGADNPVESLRSFIAQHQPSVIGLTFGVSVDVGWLADSLWAISQAAPEARIMLGGIAVPPAFRGSYPFVVSSSDVVHTVEELLGKPAAPMPPVVEALRSGAVLPSHPGHVEGDTDDLASRWARAADDAVELAREHVRRAQAYRTPAFRDSHTGLGNRRAFEDELSALTRSNVGGAVLMIDVDKFKAVNDKHGHAVGDQLLRSIAEAIAGAVRPGDTPARVGGDEFAVLLPRASIALAAGVGERVRAAVLASNTLRVSVSVGVSGLSDDPRAAMLGADIALYDAKSAGRDCIATSPQGPGSAERRSVRRHDGQIDLPPG